MSPPIGNLFDEYPDETRDEEEEMDHGFGMQEITLLHQPEPSTAGTLPNCGMTPEEVEALAVDYRTTDSQVRPSGYRFSGSIEDTFVISGPKTGFAIDKGIRGRYFEEHAEAKRWVLETYGAILETVVIPHKWAFRVIKPSAPGGRYTPPQDVQ